MVSKAKVRVRGILRSVDVPPARFLVPYVLWVLNFLSLPPYGDWIMVKMEYDS